MQLERARERERLGMSRFRCVIQCTREAQWASELQPLKTRSTSEEKKKANAFVTE